VAGIFKSNPYYGYTIFASLDNVNFSNADENQHSVVIIGTLDDGVDKNKVNASINAINPNFGAVFSKEDILDENSFKKLFDNIIFTIKGIVIIIGSILVGHAILSSVNDRTREIGVLKAVGWNNKRITVMLIAESLVLCVIGWIIALIISLLIGFVLYSTMELPLVFTVYNIFESFIIVLAMGLIGSVFPVWKAVKLPPTEAISYE
jgi:putative ABC transport system permease protein